MKFFKIENYEKYQAKKGDRNIFPWIMLHKKIMNDWAYGELTVGERLMYVHMLLIADSVNNEFPMDTKWLHLRLQVKAPLKLEKFERLGFISFLGAQEDINLEDINLEEKRVDPPPRRRVQPDRTTTQNLCVQDCLTHYESEYMRMFQKIPMVFAVNDSQKLKPIAEKRGIEETNSLITRYLEIDDDEKILRAGHPLCLFPSAINKILNGKKIINPEKKKYVGGIPTSPEHEARLAKIHADAMKAEELKNA